MSDPSWSRAEIGRLTRSSSTTLLPALTWHPIPGLLVQKNSPFPVANQVDNSLEIEVFSNSVLQGEEQLAHTSYQNSENSDRQSNFDYDAPFDFDPENHPHRVAVAARGIFEDLHIDDMTNHIKMDTYSGELGNKRHRFIDDCQTQ